MYGSLGNKVRPCLKKEKREKEEEKRQVDIQSTHQAKVHDSSPSI